MDEREMASRVDLKSRHRPRVVAEVMRRQFISVEPTESLEEADQLMRLARIRHLPVVHERRLVGILSHRDLLEASLTSANGHSPEERTAWLRELPVERVMTPSPETVTPETTLADAAARLFQFRIGCLPVVDVDADEAQIVGLITEVDLLKAAYDPSFSREGPAPE